MIKKEEFLSKRNVFKKEEFRSKRRRGLKKKSFLKEVGVQKEEFLSKRNVIYKRRVS